MRSPRLLVTVLSAALVLAGPLWLRAQSVDQLAAAYSGTLRWDQASATLRFSGSGNITFTKERARSFIWQIPAEVDGCHIENSNGTLVSLREDAMTLRGSITNAHNAVHFPIYPGKQWAGKSTNGIYSDWVQLEGVRDLEWKLVLPASLTNAPAKKAAKAAAQARRSPQLFNLKTDVGETTDVAAQHSEIVARLQQLVAQMKDDLGTNGPAPGSRPLGKVANPQPLIADDVKPEAGVADPAPGTQAAVAATNAAPAERPQARRQNKPEIPEVARPDAPKRAIEGSLPNLGDYTEGFGNKRTMFTYANPTAFPAPLTNLAASASGHGEVAEGSYTVRIGEPPARMKTLKAQRAVKP